METFPTQTYPVKALREQVTALEAALSVCLADPGGKPVHRLRTGTRRVEAQLLLLALVPGLPEHRHEAGALLRALRKLRRAGGTVRDLDVHRDMLEELAGADESLAEAAPAQAAQPPAEQEGLPRQSPKQRARKPKAGAAVAADSQSTGTRGGESPDLVDLLVPAHALQHAARELRDHLKGQRGKAADVLVHLLKTRQAKAAAAAEALVHTLEPSIETALPATELLRDANAVLTRDGLLARRDLGTLSSDELHTVRKAAKAARYLAETLPEDEVVAAAARRFEALQEAGGQWHDTLELAREARRFFGKDHALTSFYKAERNRKLALYRDALRAEAKLDAPRAVSKSRRKPKPHRAPAPPSPQTAEEVTEAS